MWLVTTKGFLSLVQDRHDSDILQVRARIREDITAHFPGAKIIVAHGGDYRYRARISKAQVAVKLAELVLNDLHYTGHFKDVALAKGPNNASRRKAYYATWSAMAGMQDYAPYAKSPRSLGTTFKSTTTTVTTKPTTTTAGTKPASVPLPTFSDAKSIPGNPWGGAASKIERDEDAREADAWELGLEGDTRDTRWDSYHNDTPQPNGTAYDDDTLDEVELAFGVSVETLTDEELAILVDELSDLNIRQYAASAAASAVPELSDDEDRQVQAQRRKPRKPNRKRAHTKRGRYIKGR